VQAISIPQARLDVLNDLTTRIRKSGTKIVAGNCADATEYAKMKLEQERGHVIKPRFYEAAATRKAFLERSFGVSLRVHALVRAVLAISIDTLLVAQCSSNPVVLRLHHLQGIPERAQARRSTSSF
jgi:hypothetical protein